MSNENGKAWKLSESLFIGFGGTIVWAGLSVGGFWLSAREPGRALPLTSASFGVSDILHVVLIGLAGFGAHALVSHQWAKWMERHRPEKLANYHEDLARRDASTWWKKAARYILWGLSLVGGPEVEEAISRWLPLLILYRHPLLGMGIFLVQQPLWSVSHYYQVKRRTLWVRVQHLWLISGVYTATMIAGYGWTRNIWVALGSAVLAHTLHNFVNSISLRYRQAMGVAAHLLAGEGIAKEEQA